MTHFVDSEHPAFIAFAREATAGAKTEGEKASALFRAVREKLRYDPYAITGNPEDYVASNVLKTDRGYCIPKAVLLAAAARAVGMKARLGFSDVKNHLTSPKLTATLGSDLFVYHGYVELWIDGTPYKVTPAFNEALCARFGVAVLDLDPVHPADALLQQFDGQGREYMSYVAQRGVYDELPFDMIMSTFREVYPKLDLGPKTTHDEAFHG